MTTLAPARCHRPGFTLVETTVVSGLMVLLVMLIAQTWSGFGRPVVDSLTRCRVAQEARLATTALAGDLGGYLSDGAGRLGTTAQGQLVGRMQPSGSELW